MLFDVLKTVFHSTSVMMIGYDYHIKCCKWLHNSSLKENISILVDVFYRPVKSDRSYGLQDKMSGH